MGSAIKLKVLALDDGDGFIHYEITISNGQIRTELDFYDSIDTFQGFGEKLSDFPRKITDPITFQVGEDDIEWAFFLNLKVYCYEPDGKSALRVIIDNHRDEPYLEKSEFSIRTLPSSLNRLGQGLKNWNPRIDSEFNWES
ncbi:hypothetical protein GU926_07750 [Nibribacter ruber]|uniref:Uncharacterized protein n=1 Tax=Nibribacter ruber TaxID=2698458 RepID=A0A6P1P1J2_9BACT|nr:hypothetical protein [Nibribacter ruber]QHL87332.1 hypothetical protein GU926_07750 [Nibribacter ruber]